MHLEHISLLNFKNIEHAELDFATSINGLVGDNGAGKSNILDAIHFLSMSKSMLPLTDGQSVRHGSEFFVVDGKYRTSSSRQEVISCSYSRQRSAGKTLKRNGKEYERLSDHVGLIPVVVVSPYDTALISDSAEERRRFLNLLISQFDSQYLMSLIKYNALLQQRNRVLKSGGDEQMLQIYDQQLAPHAQLIEQRRRETLQSMTPLVCRFYELLSGGREEVNLEYHSTLTQSDFIELLAASRERDIINGHTTVGIHRDDINFSIGGYPLRKYGSQGQQKSFLVALKLAQYQKVSEAKGEQPILLLDDLFDKLDRGRVEQLIRLVSGEEFGQIFISDCNRERLQSILGKADVEYKIFQVNQGKIADQEEQSANQEEQSANQEEQSANQKKQSANQEEQ
ncbi:MAG: DNA replication and repair protein RecF [Rikenellaceae bacterium]